MKIQGRNSIPTLAATLALLLPISCATQATRNPAEVPGAEATAGEDASSATTNAAASPRSIFAGPAWVVLSAHEVAGKYDTLWALSDIHGQARSLAKLLYRAKLVDRAETGANWVKSGQLVVFAGDYIDGGEEGVEILDWLRKLTSQARARGSRIITLMGNHEAELVAHADPSSLESETLRSFSRVLNVRRKDLTESAIRRSDAFRFTRSMPLGAVIGPWLIGHAGLLDTKPSRLAEYVSELSSLWEGKSRGLTESFEKLSDDNGRLGAFLSRHEWWKDENNGLQEVLSSIGLRGLIVGHEPRVFPAKKAHEVAVSNGGWAVGLDTNLKDDGDNPDVGEMLECSTAKLEANGDLRDCRRLTMKGFRSL